MLHALLFDFFIFISTFTFILSRMDEKNGNFVLFTRTLNNERLYYEMCAFVIFFFLRNRLPVMGWKCSNFKRNSIRLVISIFILFFLLFFGFTTFLYNVITDPNAWKQWTADQRDFPKQLPSHFQMNQVLCTYNTYQYQYQYQFQFEYYIWFIKWDIPVAWQPAWKMIFHFIRGKFTYFGYFA